MKTNITVEEIQPEEIEIHTPWASMTLDEQIDAFETMVENFDRWIIEHSHTREPWEK